LKNCLVTKGLVIVIIMLFVGVGVISSTGVTIVEKTTINPIQSGGYIQDLIDNASNGDTINVPSGTYYENIIIDKSINLIGKDKDTTIIDGNDIASVINISANWVNISGFTIQSGYPYGINISSNFNKISDNKITNNIFGIIIYYSDYNIITDNNISNNAGGGLTLECCDFNTININNISFNRAHIFGLGIILSNSSRNNISYNTIISNQYWGIRLTYSSNYNDIISNKILNHQDGIHIYFSNNNILMDNNISNNENGIYLHDSKINSITSNNINSNKVYGINLKDSSSNIILKNNFQGNERFAFFSDSFWNRWKQNYWNRPRIMPKLIIGTISIHLPWPFQDIVIRWVNFDLRPSLKPYNI